MPRPKTVSDEDDLMVGILALASVGQAAGGETMMTIEQKRVPTNGAFLATEAWGDGARGTILLAMGATASMLWWPEALLRGLAEGGYRVIRFDHRDTGRSTTNAPGDVRYDVHDLAADLLAILDAWDVPAAHLVGMSLGGYVAQMSAIERPERVLSLTLIAAEPLGLNYEGEGIDPALLEQFGKLATLDWSDRAAVAAFMLGVGELSAGSGRVFDREATNARIEAELARTDSMQSAFNHSMLAGELRPGMTVTGLRTPLLVIHGSDDPVISVHAAEATARAVPDAELLVLEGAGHELADADLPAIAGAILRVVERTRS